MGDRAAYYGVQPPGELRITGQRVGDISWSSFTMAVCLLLNTKLSKAELGVSVGRGGPSKGRQYLTTCCDILC